MSAKEKFAEMSSEQLMNYMDCNPGASAKAFSYWWETHSEQSGKEKIVYRDRVRTETVYEDRVVEKKVKVEVKEPLNKVFIGITALSLFFAGIMGSSAVVTAAQNDSLTSQEYVNPPVEYREVRVEVIPDDYQELKENNQRLQSRIDTQAETIRVLQENN